MSKWYYFVIYTKKDDEFPKPGVEFYETYTEAVAFKQRMQNKGYTCYIYNGNRVSDYS